MILQKDENGMLVSECKNCIFAEWVPTTDYHKEQVGCVFNRIKRFQERGTHVELVEGDAVSSYNIHVFCNNIRDNDWLKEQNCTLESAKTKVRQDNTVRYSTIIYTENSQINVVLSTLNSVLNSKIQPKLVHISLYNKSIDFIELISQVRKIESGIPIYFNRILENKYNNYLIDSVAEKLDTNYYLSIEAGKILDSEFVSTVDSLINDECKMVSIAEKDGYKLVNRLVHNSLLGHTEVSNGEKSIFDLEEKLVMINENYKDTIIKL